MGVDMNSNTPTLSEQDVDRQVAIRDARPPSLTSQEIAEYRELKRSRAAASAPPPAPPQSVTAQLTARHWTGIATALLGVLGVAGAGGYTGVSTLTDAEVAQRDTQNRAIVAEELEKVVNRMTAVADKDRDTAQEKFEEIKDDLHDISKNVAVLEERTRARDK